MSRRYGDLVAHCEKAVADGFAGRKNVTTDPQLDGCLGCHYLAVVYHSAAISASRGLARRLPRENLPLTGTKRSITGHSSSMTIFLDVLTNRARLLNDPRVDVIVRPTAAPRTSSGTFRVNVAARRRRRGAWTNWTI